jgi:hypothetical protein
VFYGANTKPAPDHSKKASVTKPSAH